ncbi:MAG TPA: OmpA family protein [Myxococcota bacterium]|nr:OmpA family protein [Myxococcota bacterium]
MRPIALSILVAGVLVTTGCASSRTTTPVTAEAHDGPARGEQARTEAATGELRQALIELSRVHFAYNQASLHPSARQALTNAAKSLERHPDVVLYIEGHADQRGDSAYNLALSRDRAEAVARFLVSLGVARDRLEIGSYGQTRLLARGSDQASLAKNRRADFRLVRGEVELVVDEGVLVDDAGRPLPSGNAAAR